MLHPRRLAPGLVVALLAALPAVAGTARAVEDGSWSERLIARLLERAASGPGRTVAIQGFRTEGLSGLSAAAITVADAGGVWLRIEHPVLDWHPGALLHGRIDIESLAAGGIEMLRRPQPATTAPGGAALPAVPVRLGRFSAPLTLDAPVAGTLLRLQLAGSAMLRRSGGPLDIGLTAEDGSQVGMSGQLGADALDLSWRASVPELARWQAIVGQVMAGPVSASGTVTGRLAAPDLAGHLDWGRGGVAALGWDGASLGMQLAPSAGGWAATAGLAVAAPRSGGKALAPRALLSLSGDVDAAAGRVRLGHMRLEAAGASVSGFGTVEDWGRRMVLVVAAGSSALDRLPGLSGGRLRGGGALHGVLAGDLLSGRLQVVGTARGRGMTLGTGVADRLAGPRPRVKLIGSLRAGRWYATNVALDGAQASIRAMGPLAPRLGLWVTGSLPALRAVATALSGSAQVWGRLKGSASDPGGWGVADGAVAVAGLPPAEGRFGFDLGYLASRPVGTLTTDMRLHGHPLLAFARLDTSQEIRIDDLQVRSGPAHLEGGLAVVGGRARGLLTADIPELAAWRDLLGPAVAGGSLTGRVTLDPARGQSARIETTIAGLDAGGTTARAVRVDADLTGIDTGLQVGATAMADGVQRGKLSLVHARASVAGSRNDLRFVVDGSDPARFAAAGRAQFPGGGGGSAVLEKLGLDYAGRRVDLLAPARAEWRTGLFRLAPTRLAVSGGRLEAEGERAGKRLAGRLRLDGVPVDLVDLVEPNLEATGRVNGTVRLEGTTAAPQATADLEGAGLSLGGTATAGLGSISARLRADWRGNRLTARASAAGNRIDAEAEGSLPVVVGGGPLLPPGGAVEGRLRLVADASTLTAVMPLGVSTVAGQVRADLVAAGTLAAPRVTGRASLTGGRYENAQSGTVVANLTARADLEGDAVRLHAEGTDGGSGHMRLDGDGRMTGLAVAYQAAVGLTGFRLLRSDELAATVSGDLKMAGQGVESRLSGTVAVDRADIDVARLGGRAGPVALPVVEIDRPAWEVAEQAARKPEATRGPLTVDLGLDVAVDHAFVRGRGLDSEWQGRLGVDGTLTHPSVTGKLSVVRGQYDLLGHTFKLDPDGTVTFMGGETIDPALAVTAEAKARDITATATISGTAHAPQLDFTSEPPLPKDEILARVLFDTSLGSLSAFQQLQLAQMAASGLGAGLGGGGFDPLGDIRGALGLDVLQVGSAEQQVGSTATQTGKTAPTLSLGKYVGPNTFVRVEQGIQGLGQVTVEREVGGGVSLSTSLGQQQGSGVGINWRMDY